jgi:hypothetical protein
MDGIDGDGSTWRSRWVRPMARGCWPGQSMLSSLGTSASISDDLVKPSADRARHRTAVWTLQAGMLAAVLLGALAMRAGPVAAEGDRVSQSDPTATEPESPASAAAAPAQPASPADTVAKVEPASDVEQRLLKDVQTLASDDWEGRGVGLPGLAQAANWVQDQLRQAGVDVTRINGQGLQTFEMSTGSELLPGATLELLGPEGKTVSLSLGDDFQVCSFGGSGEFTGELVFVGYGIDAPELQYNDFAGIDLKGKVAVIMRRTPQQANPASPFNGGHGHGISRHAELRTKLLNANAKEAAAVLFVNDPYAIREIVKTRQSAVHTAAEAVAKAAKAFLDAPAEAPAAAEARTMLQDLVTGWEAAQAQLTNGRVDELMPFGYAGHADGKPLPPAAHVSQAKLNEVLEAVGLKSLADLETAIDTVLAPQSTVLTGWTCRGKLLTKQTKSAVSNVIGVLEGEGSLAEETIVVGAHYDHVGRGGPNSLAPGSNEIHNGADDNASGTAALIELARRLAARPQKLPRRVVFIAFTAEELGLIGSARYVKEPLVPIEQTVAMFNMDMVGRLQDNKLTIFGSGTSTRWEPLLKSLNEQSGFQLSLKPEGFGPSDHSSFYGKKIPVLHLFTGNHPDYHRPSDDWEKLNLEGISRVVDYLEQIVIDTAQQATRPDYVEVAQPAMAQRGGNRPYFGTIPDFGSDQPGYSVSGASPGSPADKAGMKAGDAIIKLGDNKVTGLDDFDLALRKFKAGETIAVVVLRGGQEVTLQVTLAPPR